MAPLVKKRIATANRARRISTGGRGAREGRGAGAGDCVGGWAGVGDGVGGGVVVIRAWSLSLNGEEFLWLGRSTHHPTLTGGAALADG